MRFEVWLVLSLHGPRTVNLQAMELVAVTTITRAYKQEYLEAISGDRLWIFTRRYTHTHTTSCYACNPQHVGSSDLLSDPHRAMSRSSTTSNCRFTPINSSVDQTTLFKQMFSRGPECERLFSDSDQHESTTGLEISSNASDFGHGSSVNIQGR